MVAKVVTKCSASEGERDESQSLQKIDEQVKVTSKWQYDDSSLLNAWQIQVQTFFDKLSVPNSMRFSCE